MLINTLSNAKTLELFDLYETQSLKPKLGIYNAHTLVIVNKKSVKFYDYIIQLFKNIVYFIYEKTGHLKYDSEQISLLKNEVNDFYLTKKNVFSALREKEFEEKMAAINANNLIITEQNTTIQTNSKKIADQYTEISSKEETLIATTQKLTELKKEVALESDLLDTYEKKTEVYREKLILQKEDTQRLAHEIELLDKQKQIQLDHIDAMTHQLTCSQSENP